MPDEAKSPAEAEVAVVYPHDEFQSGIKGVEPLTQDYSPVPKAKLQELRKVAREAGVTISVRGE